jgi:hypothetical protein
MCDLVLTETDEETAERLSQGRAANALIEAWDSNPKRTKVDPARIYQMLQRVQAKTKRSAA